MTLWIAVVLIWLALDVGFVLGCMYVASRWRRAIGRQSIPVYLLVPKPQGIDEATPADAFDWEGAHLP